MLGFMMKDLAVIKSNFKLLAILIIVYAVMGLTGEMDISFILPFMSVVVMISSFSYDEFNKWDSYAATFPGGRKDSVRAKYLATILMLLIISIITTSLSFIIAYNKTKTFDYEYIFSTTLGTVFGTILVLSFMYPIIYKLGIEKARIAIFVTIFGIAILGGLLINYIDLATLLNGLAFLENYWVFIIIILGIAFLYGSYRLSLRFQMRKEL